MIGRTSQRERANLAAFEPPVNLYRPKHWVTPVIFASPHSGNKYPASFLSQSRLHLRDLRRNEDVYIDRLYSSALDWGAPLIAAKFPRCFVDVNRAVDELPRKWRESSEPSTARAENGLGVVPTFIAERMPIYKRPLSAEQASARIKALHKPYHTLLERLICAAHECFGRTLLVDCHSMPGFTAQGSRRPDVILGDRHGISCRPETTEFIKILFETKGYSVAKNYPYAGGYVASHYGRPMDGVEVIQIELNRDLYLNPITYAPKTGYERLAQDLNDIIGHITRHNQASELLAAE